MSEASTPTPPPPPPARWNNPFEQPDDQKLHEHYPEEIAALFHDVRARLLKLDGIEETLEWQGVSWQWALLYRLQSNTERAWVYLIPRPEKPTIAMPLARKDASKISSPKLKRFVRDGLATGTTVGNTIWVTWNFGAKTELEDMMDFLTQRHTEYKKK